jgi:hypothetical protein
MKRIIRFFRDWWSKPDEDRWARPWEDKPYDEAHSAEGDAINRAHEQLPKWQRY